MTAPTTPERPALPAVRHQEDEALCREIGFDCPWRYNAARLLFDNIQQGRGAARAILADSGGWSYAALGAEANRIGNALLARGLRRGDRVLLFLDDEPACPAAIMGAMKAGLVPVLLNTLSPPDLVRFFVEDSGARAALVSASLRDRFSGAALSGTGCETMIVTGAGSGGLTGWEAVASAPDQLDEAPTTREDAAFWMYSSGSTGRPKGVVHRHEDALYTHASYARHILRLTPDDLCFSVPKVFFAYGFGNSITFPFAAGAASLLMTGRPEPARVFDQIARHRPSVLFGLPTLYTALARHASTESADLSSVRLCVSAAEILSADIANAWAVRFGHHIVEGLGSTEMLHIYLSNDECRRKPGSAGRRVPGYAIRLLTPDGRETAEGDEGVMAVRGISGARHYWNRPDKTAETMREGWIWTGDRFVRDRDGFYFFKGRADDLVKVSGQWVWPLEVELALAEHPGVHECAVLAVEMADRRMTLVAFVVPASGVAPGGELAEALKAHARRVLLPHKFPREVRFRTALPKTGTGKIDRQALTTAAMRPERPVPA